MIFSPVFSSNFDRVPFLSVSSELKICFSWISSSFWVLKPANIEIIVFSKLVLEINFVKFFVIYESYRFSVFISLTFISSNKFVSQE
jgi:hypothetical protein